MHVQFTSCIQGVVATNYAFNFYHYIEKVTGAPKLITADSRRLVNNLDESNQSEFTNKLTQ